jgi:hypothetical protein
MVFGKSRLAHRDRSVISLWLRSSSRILQLKLSEGQTWRSEDTGTFSFKVFFDAWLAASICLTPLRTALTAVGFSEAETHCLILGPLQFVPYEIIFFVGPI